MDNPDANPKRKIDADTQDLSPSIKIAFLFIYVFTTVSFQKYDLFATALFAAPVLFALFALSQNIVKALRNSLAAIPIALLIGAANLWFDRTPMYDFGFFKISGGFVSLCVLCLKAWECVLAASVFAQCTSASQTARGLAALKIPCPIALQLSLTMRYIPIITNEARTILDAYNLRSGRISRAARISEWPMLAGSLMLRSFDRATNVYRAMCARGFEAKHPCMNSPQKISFKEILIVSVFACVCAAFRFIPKQF